jgi:hypothetical protein
MAIQPSFLFFNILSNIPIFVYENIVIIFFTLYHNTTKQFSELLKLVESFKRLTN